MLFAVPSDELVVCAETAEVAWESAAPTFECFDPDLAPPVPTARPVWAAAVRLDDATAFDPALEEPDVPFAEVEFAPAPDDPVDPSAHATPYPVENNAAPTPRATANPPTRPTNLEAPIVFLPPDQRRKRLSGG